MLRLPLFPEDLRSSLIQPRLFFQTFPGTFLTYLPSTLQSNHATSRSVFILFVPCFSPVSSLGQCSPSGMPFPVISELPKPTYWRPSSPIISPCEVFKDPHPQGSEEITSLSPEHPQAFSMALSPSVLELYVLDTYVVLTPTYQSKALTVQRKCLSHLLFFQCRIPGTYWVPMEECMNEWDKFNWDQTYIKMLWVGHWVAGIC